MGNKGGSHQLGTTFIPGQWFPIDVPKVRVGLGWDFLPGDVFDLDGSVTGFNECNEPVDSIYYHHLTGLNGSVKHHGDNLTGKGSGDDEVITIELNKVPSNVLSLAVTVNSYSRKSIIKAKSAFIRLVNGKTKKEMGRFVLNQTKDCIGLLLGLFERNRQTGGWFFRVMVDPLEGNTVKESYPSLKTLLNGYTESFNSGVVNYQPRHPLPNEPVFTPETWIDMNPLEIIYHKNLKSVDGSIVHYGDNRTGIGEGDDEVLSVNLAAVNPNVNTMAVIVNSFKGNSMVGLRSAFIRLYDQSKLIGCHVLGQGTETTGLLLGLFRKDFANNVWLFQVMISPVPGREAQDSVQQLRVILDKYKMPL